MGWLASVLVDGGVKLPVGTGNMLSLQELQLINVSKRPSRFWVELSKLTNLRKLSLSLERGGVDDDAERLKEHATHMVSSICKIGRVNLHSLSISIGKDYEHHFLQEPWNPPPSNLSRIVIKKEPIPRVPNWIGSSLVNLQQLYLCMKSVGPEDVSILGSIPALLQLVLFVTFEKKKPQRPPHKKGDKKTKKTDKNREEKDKLKDKEIFEEKEAEVDKNTMVNDEEVEEKKKVMVKEENVKVKKDEKNKIVIKEVMRKETMDDVASGSKGGRTDQGKEMDPRKDSSDENTRGKKIE